MHPRLTRRVLPARLLFGLLIPLIGFLWLSAEKAVAVTVDGHTLELRTHAATVGEALARAEIPVDRSDHVAPAPSTPLTDGMAIAVRRDEEAAAVVDPGPRRERTRTSRLGRREAVVPFTLVADGSERALATAATTVGGVLHEHGLTLGDQDRITPGLEAPVTPGLRIVLERVEVARETVDVEVPFATEERDDPSLPRGERVVLEEGSNGLVRRTVETVVVDGVEESRTVVAEETLEPTEPAVVAVGTAAPEPEPAEAEPEPPAPDPAPAPDPQPAPRAAEAQAPQRSAPPAREAAASVPDGSVWDRLAACESGGNWSANTGNGYYGGLQFSPAAWQGVGGSGYPHEHSRETQIAMGKRLQAAQGWGAWPHCSAELGLR